MSAHTDHDQAIDNAYASGRANELEDVTAEILALRHELRREHLDHANVNPASACCPAWKRV